MKNNGLKNSKAITLIALIVTIIVLLILAGVSIAVLTGENGLLNRATTAKQTHEEKTEEEKLKLGVLALSTEYRSQTTHTADEDKFSKFVNKEANKTKLANELGVAASAIEIDTAKDILTYRDKKYKLDSVGGIADYTPVAVTINIDGTDTQITADDDMSDYYGKVVTNYTTGGTYRIFYIDFAGDYGAEGTIYLKADSIQHNETLSSKIAYSPIDTSILETMNPSWALTRIQYKDDTNDDTKWRGNEHCAAYLCEPTTSSATSSQTWSNYFDAEKANYAIGAPSLEMFVKSYNNVTHNNGCDILDISYVDTLSPGYRYNTESTIDNVGYSMMYCSFWISSPHYFEINAFGNVCLVDTERLSNATFISPEPNIAPMVSLKSTFIPQISSTN